ncbi:MAG: hypothetical protein ACT4OG_09880 [Alphaproteobacteria bacterium]
MEKVSALQDFLSRLPPATASRLAEAVEADRQAGGSGLPHDVILQALRPQLSAHRNEQLFGELEMHAHAIRDARPADFNEEELSAHLSAFLRVSAELLREHGTGDSKDAARLAKFRTLVADVMTGFMERAPRAIVAALPIRKLGAFGFRNPKRLDLSAAPDGEKAAQARRFAVLLTECRALALPLGFDAEFRPALDDTVSALRRYGEDIAREVRVATLETGPNAEAHLAVAADLFGILFGKEEADLLRRNSYAG